MNETSLSAVAPLTKPKDALGAVAEMGRELSELDKSLERLESRLAVVIAQNRPMSGGTLKSTEGLSSPLGSQIMSQTELVRGLLMRIENLLESVEL